jgi:hypothetical protein
MPELRHGRRSASLRRPSTAIRVIVTAVALGLLILAVGVAVSIMRAPRTAQTPGAISGPTSGEADYRSGLSALASGDTTKATELLTAAAAAGNTAAKAKLAGISKDPTATTAPTPAAYLKAASNMGTFLPASVSGYRLAQVETSTASAIVSAEPSDRTARLSIPRVELAVLDKGTVAGASQWVSELSKAFPAQVSPVTVGDTTGRFGTDASHLAVVAFSRGRFAFEVVVTVVRGTPAAQMATAVQLAETFAAARVSK